MATTKIWAIKNSLADAIDYVRNPAKCAFDYVTADGKEMTRLLQTGINCDIDHALYEMQDVKTQFGKHGGILAHHAEQSFKPGDITAELAHEIGVRFAEKMWGERFQVTVCTHTDKAHIHNHFIINSVSFLDGGKYNGDKASYRRMRELSDELCKEYALSIVEKPRDKGKSRAEVHIEKSGRPSHRKNLKSDIDYAVSKAASMDDFYTILRDMGYEVKLGKHVAVLMPGADKYIRLRSLKDEKYIPDGIRRRIAENYSRNFGVIYKGKKMKAYCRRPGQKLTGYKALYVRYLFALGKIPQKKAIKPSYHTVRQLRRLDGISRQVRLIFANGIENEGDLKRHESTLKERYRDLEQLRAEKRKEVRRVLPEAEISKLRGEITDLTKELGNIRRELATCRGIAQTAPVDRASLRIRESEVNRHEHGRRFRGNDR